MPSRYIARPSFFETSAGTAAGVDSSEQANESFLEEGALCWILYIKRVGFVQQQLLNPPPILTAPVPHWGGKRRRNSSKQGKSTDDLRDDKFEQLVPTV